MEAIADGLPRVAAPDALGEWQWKRVVVLLGLSPQQARIVARILEGKPDKQIAREMGVRVPTVRTYLTRIFQRTGAADRVELVLHVFACAATLREHEGCHQK
jgi:DNA-binding CsgD family transcriptional regulator